MAVSLFHFLRAFLFSPFFIALKFLWGRAGEGGRYLRGAAAGIALSLVPIMVTLIVADGMIQGITSRYLELGTGHIQVYDYLNFGEMDIETQQEINAIPNVRGSWKEKQGLGLLLGNHGRVGAAIRAVESGFWKDSGSAQYLEVFAGSAELESDTEVLLGKNLAETLNVNPGQNVRLMTIRKNESGINVPRVTIFKVKGIISSGYRDLDSLWCIMTYDSGCALLAPELYRSTLIVKVNDPYRDSGKTIRQISAYMGSGVGVYTWKDLNQPLYRSFESTRQMLLFIMAILVLVAAVNVSSATSMLVIERQRDIAVLKTGGASPRFIVRVFLCAAFLTGLAGAIIGITLGLLLGKGINTIVYGLEKFLTFLSSPWQKEVKLLDPDFYLETIPIVIDWNMVLFIGIFTLLCSCFASLIPARNAGKLKPLEILRRI